MMTLKKTDFRVWLWARTLAVLEIADLAGADDGLVDAYPGQCAVQD